MKNIIYTFSLISFLFLSVGCSVQKKYTKTISQHRAEYKADFLSNEHSPLKENDMAFLRFFDADRNYVITADFELTTDAKPFKMATYSGITKDYIKYGTASFSLKNETVRLAIYRSIKLAQMPQYRDYLFLPFMDATNDELTYGGGRYIDLKTTDIIDGKVVLDFNKVYNPYCAYSDGYSCPIPPKENHLDIAIEAGEKKFEGEYKGEKH